MKIKRITIKKFRSVETATFDIDRVNAIVGANNVGKSSLLKALNAFFNFEEEYQSFLSGSHSYAPGTRPKIEILFSGLPPQLSAFSDQDSLLVETTISKTAKRTIKYRKNNQWLSADEELMSKIKHYITFVFIPPNRDGHSLTKTENSVLRLLIEAFMDNETQNRDLYSNKFREAFKFLEDHALLKISKEAKKEYPIASQIDFAVQCRSFITYKDFLDRIHVSVKEGILTHSLTDCGSGIQSLTIIALYNLLGKLKHENIIIGLEEPETNLHPQAQREMIAYFQRLAEKDNIPHFFFTTHSVQMIDAVDHQQVIYFRKEPDEKRGFKSQTDKLPVDFFEKYKLDEFKYYQFHRYKNSEFFFARFVVITESKNEIEIINRIAEKSGLDLAISGIEFLSLDGVLNIKYPIYLLRELRIPFLLIVDKDFFTPYINDDLKSSRSSAGFPRYKSAFSPDSITIIETLIPDKKVRAALLSNLKSNHTKALDILEKHNIISMRYTLDLDLANSSQGSSKYFSLLKISVADQTKKHLVVNNYKAIKRIDNMVQVFDSMTTSGWPHSFSRIKNYLKKKVVELKR
jgi:predicted ATP-dependent endonuclease of OLD family